MATTDAPESDASGPASPADRATRWDGLDLMRLVAAIAIVWLHTTGSLPTVVGRFAVPFFSASIGFLVVTQTLRKPQQGLQSFAVKRFARLLIPFYVWTLLYGVVRFGASLWTEHVSAVRIELSILWNGSAHHLWFLPYAFALSLAAFVLARRIPDAPRAWATGLTVAALACLVTPNPLPLAEPWYLVRLGFDTLPAGLAGMALAVSWTCPAVWRPSPSWWYLAVGIACLVAITLAATTRSGPMENLAGFAALMASLSSGVLPAIARLNRWPALPYGIYLCHVLFLEGLQDLIRIAGVTHTVGVDLAVFAAATTLSIGFCFVAQRLRMPWLIGG